MTCTARHCEDHNPPIPDDTWGDVSEVFRAMLRVKNREPNNALGFEVKKSRPRIRRKVK